MTPFPVLDDLGLVLIGAAAMLVVSRPLAIPPILAYMVAGLVLGPMTGLLRLSESLDLFSELGVALLLFVVGLELSLEKIRAFGSTASIAGGAQVVVTFALGAALAGLLGFSTPAALITGMVAAFSSTAVVVKLLDRAGDMESAHGRLSIGILLVQDVLVVVVLTTLGGLAGETQGWEGSPVTRLALALLGMAGLVLVGAAAGRWLLPGLVRWLTPSADGLFIVGLTWAFAFILAAEFLHLSVELGAFIAGVIMAQLPHTEELRRRTHPLVDFFLAVFFVSLGAGMDTGSMAATWPAALAVSVFVLTAKPLLITLLLSLLGQGPRTSFLTGLTLGQISEFAFILAGLAVAADLVPPNFLGFVGLVGLITIGASAVLVPRGWRIVRFLERGTLLSRLPGAGPDEEAPGRGLEGHVVVIGMNTLGRMIVARFLALGERVLAVDTDPRKLERIPTTTLAGDVTLPSVIEEAGIPDARLVVSALQIEDVNALVAYRCSRLGVLVSVHAFDPSLIDELLEIGADHLMVSKHDGIRSVEDGFKRLGVLG
jgi:Kef-type K+ transport system membrane component KefB